MLKAAWAVWAFPVIAAFGSILLFFYEHHSGCTALTTWPSCNTFNCRIRPFPTGFSCCLSKALSEVRTSWRSIFAKVWPLLLIVLGALLVLYKE